jgi:TPR repeat protein
MWERQDSNLNLPHHHGPLKCLKQVASYDVASIICQAIWRGVTRSKRMARQWMRTAADTGHAGACMQIARACYEAGAYQLNLSRF